MTYQRRGDSRILIDHTEVDIDLCARALPGAARRRRILGKATSTRVRRHLLYATAQFAGDPSIRDVLG
jgi:hypothetical protein